MVDEHSIQIGFCVFLQISVFNIINIKDIQIIEHLIFIRHVNLLCNGAVLFVCVYR